MPKRETLVMLPGMMCDARLFEPQMTALEADYEILVPELSGPPSMLGMAKKVLGEIEASGFNLLGISMGGIVAMAMAGLAPQRVKRLALLDTNHRADAPENAAIRNRQIEDVRQGYLRDVIIEEMKPRYLAAANRQRRDLLDLLVAMALDLGPQTFVAQSVALRDRPEASASLTNYRGPVLFLCGAEDALCPPSRHEEMARLFSGARLSILPQTGHISTLESPEAVTRELRVRTL